MKPPETGLLMLTLFGIVYIWLNIHYKENIQRQATKIEKLPFSFRKIDQMLDEVQ